MKNLILILFNLCLSSELFEDPLDGPEISIPVVAWYPSDPWLEISLQDGISIRIESIRRPMI